MLTSNVLSLPVSAPKVPIASRCIRPCRTYPPSKLVSSVLKALRLPRPRRTSKRSSTASPLRAKKHRKRLRSASVRSLPASHRVSRELCRVAPCAFQMMIPELRCPGLQRCQCPRTAKPSRSHISHLSSCSSRRPSQANLASFSRTINQFDRIQNEQSFTSNLEVYTPAQHYSLT